MYVEATSLGGLAPLELIYVGLLLSVSVSQNNTVVSTLDLNI